MLESIPGVVDVIRFGSGTPDLLIEIPHGATRTEDYRAIEKQLGSELPRELIHFFYVNTDAGAPELAEAVARKFVREEPSRSAAILRCRIPRTFIDCNRRIDAKPEEFREGKVTPGLMPWITTPDDRALLRRLYDSYVGAVRDAAAALRADGAMLLLHSYAPRTIDVEVDLKIVENLHRAYEPAVEPTWVLRPEVDVIARGTDGVSYAPEAVAATLRSEFAAAGITAADSATYPLHPSTLAWDHVMARPGRALCVEVRRDLVADPWTPFAEMTIGPEKIARLAAPLCAAVRRWW